MFRSTNLFLFACVLFNASLGSIAEARTFNLWAVWFKRPYKGPQCVLEIIGADLKQRSNNGFDRWSKPDIQVECRHHRATRYTQIEGNTYKPRFVYSAKIPYKSIRGFTFTVYDANVFEENHVIGRAFIGPLEAEKMIQSKKPVVVSLGYGIGSLKVRLTLPPKNLKNKIDAPLSNTLVTAALDTAPMEKLEVLEE